MLIFSILTEAVALTAQAAAPAVTETNLAAAADVWAMVAKAGPMVKGVMIVLVIFSLISWGIGLFKLMQIGRAKSNSYAFLDHFWKSRSLSQLYNESSDIGHYSPMSQVFRTGYQEFGRSHKAKLDQSSTINNVERALRRAGSAETARLHKYLSFLATCGNAAPFIGLFGTVWGIMGSFHEIGLKGSANLATVAPGISEALVATAVGLAAAIPAVMFFNHFNSQVQMLEAEMNNFMADFINILERDVSRRPAASGEAA